MFQKGEICERCNDFVAGFEYQGCCSGHECGCMGRPIEPCLCDKCWNLYREDGRTSTPIASEGDNNE